MSAFTTWIGWRFTANHVIIRQCRPDKSQRVNAPLKSGVVTELWPFLKFCFLENKLACYPHVIDNPNLPKLTTFNFGHHFVCKNCASSLGEITRSHCTCKKIVKGSSKIFLCIFAYFSKKNYPVSSIELCHQNKQNVKFQAENATVLGRLKI